MRLKEAFQEIQKINRAVLVLSKQGNLEAEDIARFASEYKKVWESISQIQMDFIQSAMVENVSVKCRNLFFDTFNKIDKDALKQ